MGLFDYLNRRSEKRRNDLKQRGLCVDCGGRGFYLSGFESVHVLDCPTCGGTGKLSP